MKCLGAGSICIRPVGDVPCLPARSDDDDDDVAQPPAGCLAGLLLLVAALVAVVRCLGPAAAAKSPWVESQGSISESEERCWSSGSLSRPNTC